MSIDREHGNWPVYRILEMRYWDDPTEIEANRQLIERAPALQDSLTRLLDGAEDIIRNVIHETLTSAESESGCFLYDKDRERIVADALAELRKGI